MKNKVTYEWVLEYCNGDGDIVDIDHADALTNIWQDFRDFQPDVEITRLDLGLIRYVGNDEDGEQYRGYAYVKDGALQEEFCCGHKVPVKYRAQIERLID